MSDKTFDIDLDSFVQDLTSLHHAGKETQAILQRLLVKSCKALIYRKETVYLERMMDQVQTAVIESKKYVKKWLDTVLSGKVKFAIDRLDNADLPPIAGITQVRSRHIVEISKSDPEAWANAQKVLQWLEEKNITPISIDAHLPKRTPKKSTVYEQAVDFAKALSKKLDKPAEIGKLTADQRQKMHDLLEAIKQIMPGILD